jgi:NAD(P)-dependent dehydrogenase (short-subunit alcohol dehydrogenase family)
MKNVVITGSTKGIGFGLAREFVKRGHSVAICGRGSADVMEAMERLRSEAAAGAKVIGVICDVSLAGEMQVLWDQAIAAFGSVDIWINNAGFARTGVKLADLTAAEIEAMIQSNVIGTINGSQVAVAGMQAQKHGHIYNTLGGGQDGRVLPGMIGYGTTKRALRYFTDSMVKELKDGPVKVGMISPGMNVTEGMIREMRALPAERRKGNMKFISIMGDKVETTAPWIVERVLADEAHGTHIQWMTGGKLFGRFIGAMFKKRDLFADVDLAAA